uniref:Mannosyl-glycoprotein endo-beta-N-acetylglucosamidase-like domain-containing protein n=1 Tax=candidate division WWE3 bacterium TaxID=2053526 RepID=A0A831Z0V7_UNCKA
MIFRRIRKIWTKLVRRGRTVFSLAKIHLGSRRTWHRFYLKAIVYLYILFILAAPFARIGIVHAPILPPRVEAKVDERIGKLESFLKEYDSPMVPQAAKFIAVADQYGLDWRLLPAIAGTESTFGRKIPYRSYNPFGWANGKARFASWDQAIETVGKTLYEKYYKFGTRPLTIEQVGKIYAVSPHWPKSVRHWISKLDAHQLGLAK